MEGFAEHDRRGRVSFKISSKCASMTLKLCPECEDLGSVMVRKGDPKLDVEDVFSKRCPRCKGKGIVAE